MDQDRKLYICLNECNQDIKLFSYFMYHVGTTCDTKKLRSKLRSLQEKVLNSVKIQEEAILSYLKTAVRSG